MRRLVTFALTGTAVLILVLGSTQLRISGAFIILPVHNADVRPEIEGTIEEIYVREGDSVHVGDLIARLSDRENRAELQKTEALIQQLGAKLKILERGPTREEIEVARTAVEKGADKLHFARARLQRNKALYAKALISGTELENTQELASIAEGDLAEARNKLKLLVRGARPEEIEAAKAEIASLEAQRRRLSEAVTLAGVRSPATGTVATPQRQLEALMGQAVQKGSLIAKVFDFKKLVVEMAVSEKEIADVQIGQEVAFKARAFPNETFVGTVTSTATTAQPAASGSNSASLLPDVTGTSGSSSTILVTTVIQNSGLRLKPGMTGQAKILCGERKILDLIGRRLARVMKVEFWSWW